MEVKNEHIRHRDRIALSCRGWRGLFVFWLDRGRGDGGDYTQQGGKMPAINVYPQFKPLIEKGLKTSTIRKQKIVNGKPRYRVGQSLYFYTGLRTKKAEKFFETTIGSVQNIIIDSKTCDVWIEDDSPLVSSVLEELVKTEGFIGDKTETLNACSFFRFFESRYGEIFKGVLIRWNPLVRTYTCPECGWSGSDEEVEVRFDYTEYGHCEDYYCPECDYEFDE